MRWRDAGSEQVRSWTGMMAGAAIAALLAMPSEAAAQDTTRTPAARDTSRAVTAPDTLRTPAGGTHTVKRGDTLWDLAAAYLGDAFQWPEIYRINRDVVENPHWIYPGEVLRIPGAGTGEVAETEEEILEEIEITEDQPEEPARPRGAGVTVFTPVPIVETTPLGAGADAPPLPTVRPGQIVEAPYVDLVDGPRDPGRILDTRELAGIHEESARGRYRQFEQVTITLPGDATGRAGERYVAVARGPVLEGLGQLLVPTGVLELVRPPVDGEAAIARVNGTFDDLRTEHRLVVMRGLDAPTAKAVPVPTGGQEARIRLVVDEHILPTIGSYFIIDGSSRDGLNVGDELLVYEPRGNGEAGRPDNPEVPIAKAQIVRVTPYAATAVVLSVREPRIERGKWVRVTARMP